MNQSNTGEHIRRLRTERGMTQRQLALCIGVTDKAVSKWERGLGLPDVWILPELSRALGTDLESLLCGKPSAGDNSGGNMKKLKFYVCPSCGNTLTSVSEGGVISCCGNRLEPLTPQKPDDAHALTIEKTENELFIQSEHPMTKEHYIPFLAMLTGDYMIMHRMYPEWNMQTRIPPLRSRHGTLLWYCTEHGLFYKLF